MKKIFSPFLPLVLALLVVQSLGAQANFIQEARVEYEKKVNQHKPYEEEGEDNMWQQERMKVIPRFVSDVYELKFNQKQSAYRLLKENPNNKYMMWGAKPSETEVFCTNLETQRQQIQKEIFENVYWVQDSIRQLDWKISDETREIAGFECRKAVTKICDSVYVVAFYTDQIPVSAGPESFAGLPGLILGLAIPRLYTTWFATKVELITPTTAQLNPPLKGKKVTRQQMQNDMQKSMKEWGKEGAMRMWMSQL